MIVAESVKYAPENTKSTFGIALSRKHFAQNIGDGFEKLERFASYAILNDAPNATNKITPTHPSQSFFELHAAVNKTLTVSDWSICNPLINISDAFNDNRKENFWTGMFTSKPKLLMDAMEQILE